MLKFRWFFVLQQDGNSYKRLNDSRSNFHQRMIPLGPGFGTLFPGFASEHTLSSEELVRPFRMIVHKDLVVHHL
jgi:hypothetical protein